MPRAFGCPPDCGYCCTHLKRERSFEERSEENAFREAMREMGVYGCADARDTGLVLSPPEARALRAEGAARGMDPGIHPHTFVLDEAAREAVVLAYHLPHEACPFFEDYKCTVYEARPLVCRAYPVLQASPRWHLAKACPEMAPVQRRAQQGELSRPRFFAAERMAREQVEAARVEADERLHTLLNDPARSLVEDLTEGEAGRLLASWRRKDADALPRTGRSV